jgi:hypothetical protein
MKKKVKMERKKDEGIAEILAKMQGKVSEAKDGATAVSDTKDVTNVRTEEEKEADKKGGR